MTSGLHIREIASGIHEIQLPLPMRPSIVNVWLLDGGSEWALIDTGMRTEESLRALHQAFDALALGSGAIRKIICTHHHPDHFGSSRPLRQRLEAEVLIHTLEVDRIHSFIPNPRSPEVVKFFRRHGIPVERFLDVPSPAEFWASLYHPVTPDRLLDDGDELHVGDLTLRVVWTPGHSPGHCCFYLADSRALLVGDHLLPRISPHVGVYPSGPQNPLADYLASLDKVGRLDVDLVLPAHGGVYRDHRRRVAQLKHHHEYRLLAAVDAVRARPRPAYEIAREVFDFDITAPVQVQFPATFEALAHLELLAHQGRLEKIEESSVTFFRIV